MSCRKEGRKEVNILRLEKKMCVLVTASDEASRFRRSVVWHAERQISPQLPFWYLIGLAEGEILSLA